MRPPAALGVEAAGRVTTLGQGNTEFRVGDLVLVHEAPLPGGSGTWAERTLVRAAHVARLPERVTPEFGAALPVAGLTAQQSLDELGVGTGTRLLVVGASGPTASLAVQLAHLRGADVVAGASPARADQLRAFGVDEIIDTHVEGWPEMTDRRFDAVLIAAPGTAEDAIGLVRDGGRLISITLDAPDPVRGIATSDLYVRPDARTLGELAVLVAAGELSIDVQTTSANDAPPIVNRVGAGRSGGVKYVIEF